VTLKTAQGREGLTLKAERGLTLKKPLLTVTAALKPEHGNNKQQE
jgi:hypothetical protein